MKAIEQYFSVVLFSMLYKVVLTFESTDKTIKSSSTVVSCVVVVVCFTMFLEWKLLENVFNVVLLSSKAAKVHVP